MHRFYLPAERCRGGTLTLTGGEAHRAARVLRLGVGDTVTVLDGAGGEFCCAIAGVTKREVRLELLTKKLHPASPWSITLLQAIPKGRIIESIIEKATELGVHRIVPLLTERVTTQLDKTDAEEKQTKWQTVAIEAIKQCAAPWLPQVEAPATLKEFLSRREAFDFALVGALQGEARHPRDYFRAFEAMTLGRPERIAIWIGPEGDFTREEVDLILASGAKPISLGPLVLRVETAAICCLSLVNYELRAPRD